MDLLVHVVSGNDNQSIAGRESGEAERMQLTVGDGGLGAVDDQVPGLGRGGAPESVGEPSIERV